MSSTITRDSMTNYNRVLSLVAMLLTAALVAVGCTTEVDYTMGEEFIPEQQKMQMLEDFEMRLRSQGLSIEQYMQFTGMTANKFMESMAPQALKDIQYRLVLEAIAAAEKIEVEDSELDAEYQAIADTYNMPLDKVMSVIGEEEIIGLKKDVAVRKAADLIVEAAVVK